MASVSWDSTINYVASQQAQHITKLPCWNVFEMMSVDVLTMKLWLYNMEVRSNQINPFLIIEYPQLHHEPTLEQKKESYYDIVTRVSCNRVLSYCLWFHNQKSIPQVGIYWPDVEKLTLGVIHFSTEWAKGNTAISGGQAIVTAKTIFTMVKVERQTPDPGIYFRSVHVCAITVV